MVVRVEVTVEVDSKLSDAVDIVALRNRVRMAIQDAIACGLDYGRDNGVMESFEVELIEDEYAEDRPDIV